MRRFNFTDRKKILNQDINIRLTSELNQIPVIDIAVDLDNYDFPSSAGVFLEAQWKTSLQRVKLGEVHNTVRSFGVLLDTFSDSQHLKFRIKVVNESEGRLLGVANNVKSFNKNNEFGDNQKSILPVVSKDLSATGLLWRINRTDTDAILEVEKELGSREQIVRSLCFRGFILPAAMRQILMDIVKDDWDDELTDPDDLSTRWLLFVREMGGANPEPESTNEEWLDDTLRLLANRIGVRKDIIKYFDNGGWS